jgi:hypothetical protein
MKKHASNMTKANKVFITILFLITVCVLESKAQTACTQTLRQARTVFDEGRIHELEGLLSSCIKNGFNDEERTEAYRLLILAHIYLDETDKADESMLDLLKDNHGFTINEKADPSELINLYATYRTKPIFYVGAKFGVNTTIINVQKAYGVNDQNSTNGTFKNSFGFTGALFFEKKIFQKFTAHADLAYGVNSFEFSNSYIQDFNTGLPQIEVLAIETQTSLAFSLQMQYRIFNRITKWDPYIGLGGTVNYLTKSEAEITTQRDEGSTKSGAPVDLVKEGFRSNLNPTADLELGVKRKAGLNFFTTSIRYSYGFTNITEKHYDNGLLSIGYGLVPNDINTQSITLSIGYIFSYYSPKKLIK